MISRLLRVAQRHVPVPLLSARVAGSPDLPAIVMAASHGGRRQDRRLCSRRDAADLGVRLAG